VKVIDRSRFMDTDAIVSHGADLWFRSGNRHLIEMNKASGAIKSFYNPAFEVSSTLATNGRFVWMAGDLSNTVLQFNVRTGKVLTINSPHLFNRSLNMVPFAIASEGARVWVTVLCNKLVKSGFVACGTVDRITP
jgi:hypothetical protein